MHLTKMTCLMLMLWLCRVHVAAQEITSDSLVARQLNTAIAMYHQALFPENALYNGAEYLPFPFSFVENQPFFLSNRPLNGSINYKGISYDSVKLMYDLTRQQLVIIHPQKFQRIRLTTADVHSFSILDHRFVRLQPDSNIKKNVPAGFYEVLYDGKNVTLLKSLKKTITEELSSGEGALHYIKETIQYYVSKNSSYYSLGNRKSVLNIFADKKKEMTQLLKTEKILRREDNEASYISLVKYYDQLNTNRP